MSSPSKYLPILTILFFLLPIAGISQSYNEVMSTYWSVYGFGASAFTLLNNSQLATDISSTQTNPAFLTNIKRPKAFVSGQSISVNQLSTLANVGKEYSSSTGGYLIDYIGFAYPLPVYQGSLVLAAIYSPAAYYYSSSYSKGVTGTAFYDTNSVRHIVDTDLEYDIRETGSIDVFRLSGATEFMKNFNFGLSLNFYSGERNYQATETSIDTYDSLGVSSIVYDENIKPSYYGFNMDLGLCYQSDYYKIGLRVSTPLNLSIHEVSEVKQDYTYDDGDILNYLDTYNFKYKSSYPLEIAPNFAVKVGKVTFGMDMIFHNWQKIKVDLLENDSDINRDLYWNLRNTTDIGATVAIPFGNSISTRFAYRLVPSPYENVADDEAYYHILGAGIETILNKSVIIGCSYQRGFGNQSNFYPYFETTTTQKYTEDRLSLSLAVLF